MNPIIDPRSAFERYRTRGGVTILRSAEEVDARDAVERLIDRLDDRQGVLLSSSYDYPGRYTRWDLGFAEPPLEITARGLDLDVRALSPRGALLLAPIRASLERLDALESVEATDTAIAARVRPAGARMPEELRSKQPTVFSALRAILDLFHSPDDRHLGLYGAFGYDLAFQFEPVRLARPRPADQRDLVLYLPDELLVVDHRKERALQYRYDFEYEGRSTRGVARGGPPAPNRPRPADGASGAGDAPSSPVAVERGADHAPGEYAASVELAREAFRRGDLFEVVLSQTFHEPCEAPPSELFRRLRHRNPAPYALLLNLGAEEHLVGASPEMYVRVDGDRVETCPISGTAPRGRNAVEDADQIRDLLASTKEESELTMCTDVDRNDKSRICVPGSVKILGRRQIELYSRLIHTVDHVEGRLSPGYDALDAFLTHTWAVTVTGAPKAWAMQFVEDHERSPRAWYGAAIGVLGFDGNMNTGLTLRTVRLRRGRAEVRAGATLLFDSDPAAEERETRLKASAFLDALGAAPTALPPVAQGPAPPRPGEGLRLLLVDHQDSFVHTLANYLRLTGTEVTTLRAGFPHAALDELRPDLVVLSPGPGSPSDFDVPGTLGACVARGLPVFGVCLGLQGTVEHFGGALAVLSTPVHGKPSSIRVLRAGRLFGGLPAEFRAGRYHSLHAVRERLPDCLEITAETSDGVVMAIEHRTLPIAAVQFHPESLLTLGGDVGLTILTNVVSSLARR